MYDEGYVEGDKCNRYFCEGILKNNYTDSSCTCHTGNPPCGHCTTNRSYCPVCLWDCQEEENGTYD